jgi:hypothetical protein
MRTERMSILFCVFVFFASTISAQQAASLSPLVQKYVRVSAPKIVLEHVRLIDGTGNPAVEDQNVIIEGGKIVAVQAGSDSAPSEGPSFSTSEATRQTPASSACATISITLPRRIRSILKPIPAPSSYNFR